MVGLDVGFTCASSLCLCLGALTTGEGSVRRHKLYNKMSVWLPPATLAVAIVGNHVGMLNPATGLRWVCAHWARISNMLMV